jgi:DNA end-binding protein Ku
MRSVWNGTITFGMAHVPIKLYSATESKSVHFREVHAKDGAKIEHRKICPKEDKEVPAKEIVKGFEVDEDTFVVLEKEEVKAAAGDRGKFVNIDEFVDAADIDPVFYEKTYYVGANEDKDVYRLFYEALMKSGRAGIGRFTFHDREYLVAVRAGSDTIVMDTLRFHDEVVEAGDLDIPSPGKKAQKKEVEMARKLIESLHVEFDPADYEDTYRESVLALIKQKAKGDEIDLTAQEEPEHGDDLMAALEASLSGSKG